MVNQEYLTHLKQGPISMLPEVFDLSMGLDFSKIKQKNLDFKKFVLGEPEVHKNH